ncbi:MAG TPA: phosphatase PAP2 family protein [Verrucomicrobiae bacterium]|jgi:undecaprenyl-diphosphatase|nr:phosphatase PAP2 family protein [Verrucomicrobiae bacterium]
MSKPSKKILTFLLAGGILAAGVAFQSRYQEPAPLRPAVPVLAPAARTEGLGASLLALDRKAFSVLHYGKPSPLDYVFGWTTFLGTKACLLVLIFLFMAIWDPSCLWRRFGFVAAAVLIQEGLVNLTKMISSRPRPFMDFQQGALPGMETVRVLFHPPTSQSFPSGHAAGVFCAAYLLNRLYGGKLPFLYVLAAVIAFSRIHIGVHYPADVLAGTALGFLCGHLSWKLWERARTAKGLKPQVE